MKKYAIGIDLGGTHLRFAIVSKDGKFLNYKKLDTPKESKKAWNLIKENIINIVQEKKVDFKKDILGIGLSIASPANPETGVVNWSKKLPFSGNFNILKTLKKEFKKPVFVENDLNAEALAEMNFGVLKNIKNAVILTVSSGIGSAIILDGKVYQGSNFSAGEIGHTIVNPYCRELLCNRGDTGCWEAFTSAKSLERRYFLKYKKKNEAKNIVRLAKNGDKKSFSLLKEIAYWLGIGITNIINALDPEIIVLYGDYLLETWPILEKDARKIIKERAFNSKISIKKTLLGDNGCLLGASLLVFNK